MHSRQCSRCGKELTDFASMENGVGPVCRKKNNHLFAKLIPANLPMAGVLFLQNNITSELPEPCVHRFLEAKETFTKKTATLQAQNKDYTQFVLKGADFRKEVEAIDYILSYQLSSRLRTTMVSLIRHLGYVGLAAVISGEASKSPSKIYFKDGRIFLDGTSCKAGWRKMRKIPGIRVPRYRGSKEPYSASAEYAEQFLQIVVEHWPLYEGDINELRKSAKKMAKKYKRKKETFTAETASAYIKLRSEDFVLSFVWDGDVDVWSMLGKIKKVPGNERKFDGNKKQWIFPNKHLGHVQGIVTEFYPGLIILDGPIEDTPKDLWKSKSPKRSYSRARKGIRRW